MKQMKRLFLVMMAGVSVNAFADCDTSCSTDDCCATDTTADCRGGRYTSKSVYTDIGFGQSGTYLHSSLFGNDWMDRRADGFGAGLQAVGFYGKTSGKGKEELGRRFGLCHKRCMVVAENAATDSADRDIDARHFNIETTDNDFKSTICFCPEQKFGGAVLSWKQALCRNEDESVRWWAEINAPIVHVKHDMNFKETVADTGGGIVQVDDANAVGLDNSSRVANMTEAFKQSNWKYGKIDCSKDLSETALANAEFKLGYNSIVGDSCYYGSYVGVAAPTTQDFDGCKTAGYLFAPRVGQKHWALMYGSEIEFEAYEWCESVLRVNLNLDARYWFKNEEKRSFDLKGKQWGRYMEMYENEEAAQAANDLVGASVKARPGTSGINLMTRCVDVTPGYQLNFNNAFIYEGCAFTAELGFAHYFRQAEEICPSWTEGPALKDAAGDGITNRARTIKDNFDLGTDVVVANYETSLIKKCDIDWNSGSHEAVIGHTIYGALGYEFDWCYPTALSLGGSYDFAQGNSLAHRWSVFGKLGVSF